MSLLHSGGCHCGHIRYQFSGPLQDIAHCHCSICRKVSGGIGQAVFGIVMLLIGIAIAGTG